jgi:hypothetical protein
MAASPDMTRVLVVSDTHASAADAAAVIERLQPHLDGIDHILHAGDAVCPELLDALAAFAPLDAVAGNMDPPALRARLPEQTVIELAGRRIGLIHGWGPGADLPRRVLERFCDPSGRPEVDALIFGHSHQPLHEYRHGTMLLNPGSATQRRSAPFCSAARLDLGRHLQAHILRLD